MRSFLLIVNGEDVKVEARDDETLADVRARALVESRYTRRPPEDWELRTMDGQLVDPSFPVSSFGDGTRMFLALPVGCGG